MPKIRLAGPADRAYLEQGLGAFAKYLRTSCAADPYCAAIRDDVTLANRQLIDACIDAPDATAYIADVDGVPVGLGIGRLQAPALPITTFEKVGEISVLWVEAEARGTGVASSLASALEAWFASRGARYVELSWFTANALAGDFWEGRGYEPFRVTARKLVR